MSQQSTFDDDQLSWVDCFCVVNFDLEFGQSLEAKFPETCELTEREISNICYLSFPDTNSADFDNLIYSFRFRRSNPSDASTSNSSNGSNRSVQQQLCRDYCPALQPSSTHLHGFSYFRQVKDASNRRGYFQKSLVLLSRYPFVNLFLTCIAQIAPHYFQHGIPALETIWKEMSSWPPPLPMTPMIISIFSHPLQVIIPSKHSALTAFSAHSQLNLLGTSGNSSFKTTHFCRHSLDQLIISEEMTGSLVKSGSTSSAGSSSISPRLTTHDLIRLTIPVHIHLDYVTIFRALLGNVQQVWEMVLVNEPLIVYAKNPQLVSDAVNTLVSLIWPLQYATDYRPFFTVHDPEFKLFTGNSSTPAPPVLLGVTNPHFLKMVENRFSIIGIGGQTGFGPNSNSRQGSPKVSSNNMRRSASGVALSSSLPPSESSGSLAIGNTSKRKLSAAKKIEDRLGIYTSYKPFLKRAKNLGGEFVEELSKSSPDRDFLCTLLARFFCELTGSLIGPLESFINNNLMPRQGAFNPWMAVPTLATFDVEEFISKLQTSGPQLTSNVKGDWGGLYRRFFQSPNFKAWFSRRSEELKQFISLEHLKLFSEADAQSWCEGRLEVEIIDLLMRTKDLQSRLVLSGAKLPPGLDQRLTAQYLLIARSLPSDTMDIVLSSFLVSPSSPSASGKH